MKELICPLCTSENNQVLYKCVRCFTVYCRKCEDTGNGSICPKCGMSHRMILTP